MSLRSMRRCEAVANQANELDRVFFDQVEVDVYSGAGGAGAIAFAGRRRAGGSGGRGGSILVECDGTLITLGHLRGQASVRAEQGDDADGRASGRAGAHAILRVPPNCLVVDCDTNETLAQLLVPGERFLVAEGGVGGGGNGEASQLAGQDENGCTPAGSAEQLRLRIAMALVHDMGDMGEPEQRKSSILHAVTARTRPMAADHTTAPDVFQTEWDQKKLGSAVAAPSRLTRGRVATVNADLATGTMVKREV